MQFPDPDVQVLASPAIACKTSRARKRSLGSCGGEVPASGEIEPAGSYTVGSLVRVLFDDGVKYLGKIARKEDATGHFVISFEDGEEHVLPLPHADVEHADALIEMEQWEEEKRVKSHRGGRVRAVPWWCDTPTAHPLQDGDSDGAGPLLWRRVVIKPPVKPRAIKKRTVKAADAAPAGCSESGDVMKEEPATTDKNDQTEDLVGAQEKETPKQRRRRQPKRDKDLVYDEAERQR